jgi:hypothetical protein
MPEFNQEFKLRDLGVQAITILIDFDVLKAS